MAAGCAARNHRVFWLWAPHDILFARGWLSQRPVERLDVQGAVSFVAGTPPGVVRRPGLALEGEQAFMARAGKVGRAGQDRVFRRVPAWPKRRVAGRVTHGIAVAVV